MYLCVFLSRISKFGKLVFSVRQWSMLVNVDRVLIEVK